VFSTFVIVITDNVFCEMILFEFSVHCFIFVLLLLFLKLSALLSLKKSSDCG